MQASPNDGGGGEGVDFKESFPSPVPPPTITIAIIDNRKGSTGFRPGLVGCTYSSWVTR